MSAVRSQSGAGYPGPGAVFQLVPMQSPTGAENAPKPFRMFDGYPDVMGVKQASDALGVSEAWMRAALARGDIGCFRAGRLIKVPKSALVAFIEGGGTTCKMAR